MSLFPKKVEYPFKGCREGHPMQYDHIVLTMDGQVITEESEDILMGLGLVLCVLFCVWDPVS